MVPEKAENIIKSGLVLYSGERPRWTVQKHKAAKNK